MAKKIVQYNRLGELLDKKGITQIELEELSGVTQRAISLYVNGKRQPTLDTLYRLAKALKVDPCELLNR